MTQTTPPYLPGSGYLRLSVGDIVTVPTVPPCASAPGAYSGTRVVCLLLAGTSYRRHHHINLRSRQATPEPRNPGTQEPRNPGTRLHAYIITMGREAVYKAGRHPAPAPLLLACAQTTLCVPYGAMLTPGQARPCTSTPSTAVLAECEGRGGAGPGLAGRTARPRSSGGGVLTWPCSGHCPGREGVAVRDGRGGVGAGELRFFGSCTWRSWILFWQVKGGSALHSRPWIQSSFPTLLCTAC